MADSKTDGKHFMDAAAPQTLSQQNDHIEVVHDHSNLPFPGTVHDVPRDNVHPAGPRSVKRFFYRVREIRRPYMEYIAEFWGTMILILFGDGVVAQVVLGSNGSSDAIHWTWGFGVLFGIYASGGFSGAHLNPAVTFTGALFRGLSWRKVPGYILSQLFGAFIGGLIVYGNYHDAFAAFDPEKTLKSAGVFSTYPVATISYGYAFFEEVLATAILLFLIYAITDPNNVKPVAGNLQPLMIAFVVVAIGMAFGWQTGYAINPARDLGPRIAAAACGWHGLPFHADRGYAWLPVVAPMVGGPLGGFLYDFFLYDPVDEDQGEL